MLNTPYFVFSDSLSEVISFTFILLTLYQLKHYYADYIWQNDYMLGKFREKGWVLPLAAHAGVHALCTLIIVSGALLYYGIFQAHWVAVLGLTTADLVTHFVVDRLKAGPSWLGRFRSICQHDLLRKSRMSVDRWEHKKFSNTLFWRALGTDQMLHHLTHYYIIRAVIWLVWFPKH